MIGREEAARAQILARLAASREELRQVLDPPRPEPGTAEPNTGAQRGEFPRSRTMQMLMSSRGLGALGAVAAGLFLARPALALRLLRLLPAGGLARVLLTRVFAALRTQHETTPETKQE